MLAHSAQMPRYVCHKTVHALKVRTGPRNLTREYVILTPLDTRYAPVKVTGTWYREHKVGDVGYYVVYEDGYRSWSPVEAFEKGYTPIAEGISDINSPGAMNEILGDDQVLGIIARALAGMVTRYITLVNSGDAGNWDPEGEDTVKQARAALALYDSSYSDQNPVRYTRVP